MTIGYFQVYSQSVRLLSGSNGSYSASIFGYPRLSKTYVKKENPPISCETRRILRKRCGEYRSRTDDLLHAMQALQPAELIPRNGLQIYVFKIKPQTKYLKSNLKYNVFVPIVICRYYPTQKKSPLFEMKHFAEQFS